MRTSAAGCTRSPTVTSSEAAGFDVHVYGRKHAEIHRDIPIIENTGFLVDGEVFHPGDALTVPEDPVPDPDAARATRPGSRSPR